MISDERLARIVEEMRFAGGDIQLVEVKESVERLPQSMGESVSAFANAMGGVVVLGLSERYGFKPIEGFDAKRIFDSMATLCADKMTPPVRPDMRIAQFEGAAVVVAEIMEMAPVDKPCYVTDRGMYKGSFIRTGDGDRHLSQYEIDRLVEAGLQPHHDIDVVEEALPEDLRPDLVQGLLERRRSMHPRIFGGLSDREALMALNVLARGMDGRVHPTLAGLLALGVYPQHFYPRLTVSFASFPPEGEVDGSLSLPDGGPHSRRALRHGSGGHAKRRALPGNRRQGSGMQCIDAPRLFSPRAGKPGAGQLPSQPFGYRQSRRDVRRRFVGFGG